MQVAANIPRLVICHPSAMKHASTTFQFHNICRSSEGGLKQILTLLTDTLHVELEPMLIEWSMMGDFLLLVVVALEQKW
jgi:hypothetical protein